MAHELLDDCEIGPAIEKVGRETSAQIVSREWGHLAAESDLFNHFPYTFRRNLWRPLVRKVLAPIRGNVCEPSDRTLTVNSDLSLHRVDFPYALCCFGPAQPTCVHHSEICGPMFCFSQGPGKACLKESFDLIWRQSSASSSGISRDVRHIDCVAEIIRADLFCAPCCEKNSSKNREACVHCVRSGTWYEPCTELLHITSSQIPPWLYSCLFPGGGLVTFEEKPCYPAKHGSCG